MQSQRHVRNSNMLNWRDFVFLTPFRRGVNNEKERAGCTAAAERTVQGALRRSTEARG
jgi:hypothetical protein